MRYRKWIAGVLGLTGLSVLLLVVVPSGLSVNNPDRYTASVAFSTPLYAGKTGTVFTFTLSNVGSSGKMGSANITIPTANGGFTNASTGTPVVASGKTWTAAIVGGAVQLRATATNQAIAPGDSLSVAVTADAPTTAMAYTWATAAKESIDFTTSNFTNAGTDPVVTVTPADPASLTFSVQPNDAQPPPCSAPLVCAITISVLDVDQYGNPEAGVDVRIKVDPTTGSGLLSGSECDANGLCTKQADASGVATFTDLTMNAIATNYRLLAASGPTVGILPEATQDSALFNIANQVRKCNGNSCSVRGQDQFDDITATVTGVNGNVSIALENKNATNSDACPITTPVGNLYTVNPTGTVSDGATLEISGKTLHKSNGGGVGTSFVCKNMGTNPDGTITPFHVVEFCNKTIPKNKPPCLVKLSGNGQGDLFFDMLVAYDPVTKKFDPTGYNGH